MQLLSRWMSLPRPHLKALLNPLINLALILMNPQHWMMMTPRAWRLASEIWVVTEAQQ